MGLFSGIKAVKDVQRIIHSDGTASLSMSQVVMLLINLPEASRNLTKEQSDKVYNLFKEFKKCKTKMIVGEKEYYEMALDIVSRFDDIAPYEKYSGGNELEMSFLLNEIRNAKARFAEDPEIADLLMKKERCEKTLLELRSTLEICKDSAKDFSKSALDQRLQANEISQAEYDETINNYEAVKQHIAMSPVIEADVREWLKQTNDQLEIRRKMFLANR